jgi:hypothetical protein
VNSLFHQTKIPKADMKVLVYSIFLAKTKFGKKRNLQAPRGLEDFILSSIGARFKKWE